MSGEHQESLVISMIKQHGLTPKTVKAFRNIIYAYYNNFGRKLPWRNEATPYQVFVSEIMLQQTQVDRVICKYLDFVKEFPDFFTLADASLERVLSIWKGLGYNRRALNLQKSARIIINKYHGFLPSDYHDLISLPGIGPATASSIRTFAFNIPVVFIETNIRTVFIHFFLSDRETVDDSEIKPLVEKTMDAENPAKWYNAIMDYGVLLKKKHGNPGRKSLHYKKQPPFKDSRRQIRGKILEMVLNRPGIAVSDIITILSTKRHDLSAIIEELHAEGFIAIRRKRIYISQDTRFRTA